MRKSGFSVIELIVVIGILATLFAIGSIAFIKPQQTANIDNVVNTLIADIKSQQTKAMSGDESSDYTIHFENDRYVLDGYTVSLYNISLTNINFQNQDLVFQKGSGEFNFISGQNNLTISDVGGGVSVQIYVNKYGSISKN